MQPTPAPPSRVNTCTTSDRVSLMTTRVVASVEAEASPAISKPVKVVVAPTCPQFSIQVKNHKVASCGGVVVAVKVSVTVAVNTCLRQHEGIAVDQVCDGESLDMATVKVSAPAPPLIVV